MSYMALYRKWRPDAFEEVKGQEHIVKTLKNQLTHDRIGHAYLFCGTRGTGKTTVAKLFAKAVNCEHPKEDGSPCNECAMCKAINEGNSMNVIEIDAASNNGVDNIREIRDEVMYSPTSGKYKVYIIDEVHMLSTGAFNALLKTLEEPPSYVIFILATTESHKIPVTILSRCQRYDFHRISMDVIKDRLMDLMDREGVKAEEAAIRYVAKAADGSMRDALSLLDQCIAFYLGEELTYERVLDVLGAVDMETFGELLQHIIDRDAVGAVDMIDEVIWQGRELSQFVVDFTWYLRNILLIKSDPEGAKRLDLTAENIKSLTEKADQLELETLIRYIHIFSGMTNELRYANQKRVILELNIIKLLAPQMETNYDAILDRVRQLENMVNELVARPVASVTSVPQGVPMPALEDDFDPEEELKKALKPADRESLSEIMRNWPTYISQLSGGAGRILLEHENAQVRMGEDATSLVICFVKGPNDRGSEGFLYFSNPDHLEELRSIIAENSGVDVKLQCITTSSNEGSAHRVDQIDLRKVHFPIEKED